MFLKLGPQLPTLCTILVPKSPQKQLHFTTKSVIQLQCLASNLNTNEYALKY